MSGVTIVMPLPASCRARPTRRGSSMPAGCRPETSSAGGARARAAGRLAPAGAARRRYRRSRVARGGQRRGRRSARRTLHLRSADDERQPVDVRPRDQHAPPATASAKRTPRDGKLRINAHVTLPWAGRAGRAGGRSNEASPPAVPPIPPHLPLWAANHCHRRPVRCGKRTVAKAVAAELGYRHVDSGAMYRAVGWKAIATGCRSTTRRRSRALASARGSTSSSTAS